MNLLIITNSFPPEIRSAANLFYELSESFVKNGHKVTVITEFPQEKNNKSSSKYRGRLFSREMMNNIQVFRVATISAPRNIPVLRGLEHFILAFQSLWSGLISGKQDAILVYSPPLTLGLSAYFISRLKQIPFVFNMQDIYPQCIIDLGVLKNPILIKLFEWIEKFSYKKADYVTVHSEGNREHVISKGIFPDKIIVLPNWVDTDMIYPSERLNGFRKEHDLGDKLIVSYAGVMGYAQDMEVIIKTAELLKIYDDILFLLVGDGPLKEESEEQVEALKLKNIKFLPLQPREKYPAVLSASDIGLVTLKREVVTPVVPAKLLSIMASGRPVVASIDLNGDTPKIIENSQCGYCVEPGNPEAFAQAILKLRNDEDLRNRLGRNGRKYAENHFSRNMCIKVYEKLFMEASVQA